MIREHGDHARYIATDADQSRAALDGIRHAVNRSFIASPSMAIHSTSMRWSDATGQTELPEITDRCRF